MSKRTKKMSKPARPFLKLEALEQRQLLAGVTGSGTEVGTDIVHSNGNVYDQVLMSGTSVTVTADAGQVTRVSFLDLSGDIVQAEFGGAGTLTISLDGFVAAAEATKYAQAGVKYVSGNASFTIQGSDASTNFGVFSVGTGTAHNGATNPIFTGGLTGGNNVADIARLTIVANPSNPNGSTFGGIRAGNAVFADSSGPVGIAAANVQVQDVVILGDIDASGTAIPTLMFGTSSQFGATSVAGGDLLSTNGKGINNVGSYAYGVNLVAGTNSGGTAIPAATTSAQISFVGTNPIAPQSTAFTLTAGIDTFTGSAGDDIITSTVVAGLSGLDNLDGGAGAGDTLTISDTAAITIPTSATVQNIETANFNSSAAVTGSVSGWTGLTTVNVGASTGTSNITAAATTDVSFVNSAGAVTVTGGKDVTVATTAGAVNVLTAVGDVTATTTLAAVAVTTTGGAVTTTNSGGAVTVTGTGAITATSTAVAAFNIGINGGTSVGVTSTGTTTGTITVGATTAPTGVVTISETAPVAGAATGGAITVTGGTVVSITETTSNSTAKSTTTSANTTATAGAVTVTGTATTTDVTINQNAAVAVVATVVNLTESAVITWKEFSGAGTQTIGGQTITSNGHFTAAQVAQISGGGTAITGLTVSTAPTLWTVAAASGATNVFTSTTASSNVTNVDDTTPAVTTTANGTPTVVTTNGTNNVTESAVVTWAAFSGAGTQTIGGQTITSDGDFTAAQVAQISGGGTAIAGLTITTAPTLWTVAAASGATNVFTSITPNSDETDIVVGTTTTTDNTAPTAVTTQGTTAVTGVAGIANGAISITDVNSASATAAGVITTVTVNNFGAGATVNSGALSSLTIDGTGSTVNAGTSGLLDTATATTLALNLKGTTSTGAVTIDTDVKTLNLDSNTAANTLASLVASGATAINITGDQALTLTAATTNAAAVITSTSTGAVTLGTAIAVGQTYAGGAGVDTLTLTATGTKAITTGAGNDVVTYAGVIGTGGSVDAGADTDTLVMTRAQGVTATATTAFAAKVSNFEVLSLSDAGNAAAINMSNADGINKLSIAGSTGALTVTNAAADFTLTQTALTSSAGSITLLNATGSNDTVNLAFSAADGFTNSAAYTIAAVENLVITTADTNSTAQTAAFTGLFTATSAKTVTISGDTGFSLGSDLSATTLTSVDASGITSTVASAVGGLTFTSGNFAAAATVKGTAGAGTNTIDVSAATTAIVTYVGGSGIDTVVLGTGAFANVLNLGNGTNTVTGASAGANVITGGSGADTFVTGTTGNNTVNFGDGTNAFTATTGNNTYTGGTGIDTVIVTTGANTIDVGGGTTANSVTIGAAAGLNTVTTTSTGVDTLVLSAVQTASGYYTALTGWAAGDKIDFTAVDGGNGVTEATLGAKVTLGGAASFSDYLDAATASTGTDGELNWFQYGGNTYVTVDAAANTTFLAGTDSVIQLAGLVDLSTSTSTVAGILTIV